ncbi:hypothetical protein HBI22_195730 [Parastagonospora nodorum]|nr:hypothetical protein HBI28_172630 [Parastagonospora nodorum]KAH5621435.1 hypothetical protein HBI22_195730 [Parastagonospora nodorum]KAH6197716.1 hypothetical protein HBI53_167210 [Parastagonospora nodorum]
MRFFTLLLLLAVWHCSANIIPRRVGNTLGCDGHLCSTHALSKRAARAKCSAPKKPKSQRRSQLDSAPQTPNNATLWRRMRLPQPAELEDFIKLETDSQGQAEQIIWPVGEGDNQYDVNTAMYRDFTAEFSYAAAGLRGCTMLVLISRKGIYMTHYWESISFDPDEDQLSTYENGNKETLEQIFQRVMLDGLSKGVKVEGEIVQQSLREFVSRRLGDEHVRAYLVRPRKSQRNEVNEDLGVGSAPTDQEGYPELWKKIKDKMVEIVPKIGEPGRWTEVIYDATDDINLLRSSRGKVLFKFDPLHVKKASRRGKDTRLAMMWVETREIHRDEWQD